VNTKHEIRKASPVDEIIGKTPRSVVRWGTSLVAFIFILAIAGAWIIRFPYIVPGNVIITTENPPASIMALVSGRIDRMYVNKEGQDVVKDEFLAVLESSADIESVMLLEELLNRQDLNAELSNRTEISSTLPESSDLGELQTYYSSFRAACMEYLDHIDIDSYGKKIAALSNEISGIDQLIAQLLKQETLLKEKVALAKAEFERDSIIYSKELISPQEFEDSRKSLYNDKYEMHQVGVDISLRSVEKFARLTQMADYKASRDIERRKAWLLVEEERSKLSGELNTWYRKHLLISPIPGKATFPQFWGENQSVNEGDIVMTIIPQGEQRIIAKSEIDMRGSGRVKPGRSVIIKLEGYPYLQHGVVEGVVETVTLAAHNNTYIVDIDLPNGLVTRTGEELKFSQNMSGRAEIITDRLRLIERLIEPFSYIIERNRIIAE